MQLPGTLEGLAAYCAEIGPDQVICHFLHRIHRLNPLLLAVTEEASIRQIKELQAGRSARELGSSPTTAPINKATDVASQATDCRDDRVPTDNRAEGIAHVLEANAIPRPLEGIPFLVKDVIDLAGFRTLAGCELLLPSPPATSSARIGEALLALGAVPIGKSAVPEACSQKFVDVQTFSRLHGVTRNPYRFDLTSGGSSGGSAVAVSVGMVPLAVGTDWAGSLRIPAAFCGVCTLRASRGRLTIQHPERTVPPMQPLPSDQGEPYDGQIMTAGVFTRTLKDLEYAMMPLLAPSRTWPVTPLVFASFAVSASLPSVATDIRMTEVLQQLTASLSGGKTCTAQLSTGPPLQIRNIWKAYGIFSASLTAQGSPHDPSAPKPPLPSVNEVRWARQVQRETASAVDAFLDEQQCTAWILPVCGTLPFEHNPDHKRFPLSGHAKAAAYWPTMLGYVLPFSVSCNPVVAMPLTLVEGRPCGIQILFVQLWSNHLSRSWAAAAVMRSCCPLASCWSRPLVSSSVQSKSTRNLDKSAAGYDVLRRPRKGD